MEEDYFDFEAADASSSLNEIDDSIENTDFESSDFDNSDESDYVDKLLESKGIVNKTVQIADEYGNMQSVNFDELSDQEKYDLLADDSYQPQLADHEIQMLNYLRQNNMTLQDFAQMQRQAGVQDYLAGQTPITEFDSYTDDEIIAYDFIKRFGEDMSDEEIDAEIDRLKDDPEAYQKRVDLLRSSFASEEAAQRRMYEEQVQREHAAQIGNFQNAYVAAASGMDYIHGMTLEDPDKQELLQFVLAKDAMGRTGLSRAMDDPRAVLHMAWYLLHGEETYDATVDYFKNEITRQRGGRGGTRAVTRQSKSKDAFKF